MPGDKKFRFKRARKREFSLEKDENPYL